MRFRVGVRGYFSAAHRVGDHPGACSKLHGHTYTVDFEVEGSQLGGDGMLLDIGLLKGLLKSILETYDHKYLNEVLGTDNATCEVLALDILKRLKERLPPGDFKLRIRVAESPDSWVEVVE